MYAKLDSNQQIIRRCPWIYGKRRQKTLHGWLFLTRKGKVYVNEIIPFPALNSSMFPMMERTRISFTELIINWLNFPFSDWQSINAQNVIFDSAWNFNLISKTPAWNLKKYINIERCIDQHRINLALAYCFVFFFFTLPSATNHGER